MGKKYSISCSEDRSHFVISEIKENVGPIFFIIVMVFMIGPIIFLNYDEDFPLLVFSAISVFAIKLAIWTLAAIGMIAWAFAFWKLPRLAPAIFFIMTMGALLGGLGSTPSFQVFELDCAIWSTGDPRWDGPISWVVLGFAASGPALLLVLILGAFLKWGNTTAWQDSYGRYVARSPRAFVRARVISVVSTLTIPMPFLAFLAPTLWIGLFGSSGIAPAEHINIDTGEAIRLLIDRPMETLRAGLQSDFLWPESFGGKALRIIWLLAIVPGLLASTITAVKWWSAEPDDQSKLRKARKAATKAEKAQKAAARPLIKQWIASRNVLDVFHVEHRLRTRCPDLDFPYATDTFQGRVVWARKSKSGKLDPNTWRLLALWIKGPWPELAEAALLEQGHRRKTQKNAVPRSKVTQHWDLAL